MEDATLPWSMCVATSATSLSRLGPDRFELSIYGAGSRLKRQYGLFKNALLYADRVYWAAGELVVLFLPPERAQDRDAFLHAVDGIVQAHDEFGNSIIAAGLGHIVDFERAARTRAIASSIQTTGRAEVVFNSAEDAYNPAHVVLDASDDRRLVRWDSRLAANMLMMAMAELLLPDVSTLSLEQIAELRLGLAEHLQPMRAECLRLTETLRNITPDQLSYPAIAWEARNLIATRVEPIVREVDSRARELMKARWRRLYIGITKTFGFVGAGFVSTSFWKDAFKEIMETGKDLTELSGRETSRGAAARFVLEARRLSQSAR